METLIVTPEYISTLIEKNAPQLSAEEREKAVLKILAVSFVQLIDTLFTTNSEKSLALETFKLSLSDTTALRKFETIIENKIASMPTEDRLQFGKKYTVYVEQQCKNLSNLTL